jgi:ParB/RepB/Spo0J family partition protein
MEQQLQTLLISTIRKPRISLRPVRRNSPEYVELVQSIIKDGVLQPILVRPVVNSDGKPYEVVEGWHRYEAAKEAGLLEIPCFVKELTDQQVLLVQLKCNAIRPKTQTFEYARRLKILMAQGFTMPELAAKVCKSPSWIRDQLQLNRVCEAAREPVERGEIPMTSALALANLPADLQTKFVDDAIAMPAVEFVERAKAADRDFKAFLMNERMEGAKLGAATPSLRSINVLKREALKPTQAGEVLDATSAKTPLDGWEACLGWIFRLDPLSVERRLAGRKEKQGKATATRDEFREMNRDMIKQYVKPESSNGDLRDGISIN